MLNKEIIYRKPNALSMESALFSRPTEASKISSKIYPPLMQSVWPVKDEIDEPVESVHLEGLS